MFVLTVAFGVLCSICGITSAAKINIPVFVAAAQNEIETSDEYTLDNVVAFRGFENKSLSQVQKLFQPNMNKIGSNFLKNAQVLTHMVQLLDEYSNENGVDEVSIPNNLFDTLRNGFTATSNDFDKIETLNNKLEHIVVNNSNHFKLDSHGNFHIPTDVMNDLLKTETELKNTFITLEQNCAALSQISQQISQALSTCNKAACKNQEIGAYFFSMAVKANEVGVVTFKAISEYVTKLIDNIKDAFVPNPCKANFVVIPAKELLSIFDMEMTNIGSAFENSIETLEKGMAGN